MGVWKKQSVKWFVGDTRSERGVKGAKPRTIPSKRFYGTLKTYDGKTKQVPLTEDEDTSATLLERLQRVEDERRSIGFTKIDEHRQKPIQEHVEAFRAFLESKGNTAQHVNLTMARITILLKACSVSGIEDLDAGRITTTLAALRKRKKQPLSLSTSNHYATAIKAFSRWLWTDRRTSEDLLIRLGKVNAKVDLKRVRRALTEEELKTLLWVTQQSRKSYRGRDWTFRPDDRVLLYSLAAYTGLRSIEIASLRPSSFDLERMTVTVEASNTKNRRRAVLPLHSSLVALLKPRVEADTKNDRLFPGDIIRRHMPGRVFKRDLKRAQIARKDAEGRVLDFHSLRYTFITSLAKAGVHPAKAQRLARHSDINLTMSVYTSLDVDDLRDAVERI